MLDLKDYQQLSLLKRNNPEIYELFARMEDEYLQILSHTCHDLLNSSGLVNSYIGLMEQQTPEITSNPFWEKLRRNSANNLNVLEHIGRFRYAHTRKGLREFTLSSLIDQLSAEYPQVIVKCPESDVTINGSYSNILASLQALLQNAIEAVSAETAPIINLSTCILENYICFTITDNGCGFSSGAYTNGIQPFFTEKSGHSGLGMSTAFRTAYFHEGTLTIANASNPTIVEFRIPRDCTLEME